MINPKTMKKIDDKLSVTAICDIDIKCDYISSMIYLMDLDSAIKYVDDNKIDAVIEYKENDEIIKYESKTMKNIKN